MIKELSKNYPQTFQVLLKAEDPFDVLWNDWNYIGFFVNAGIEIKISKDSYTLKHKDVVFSGKVTKYPLEKLVNAGFKILEDYIMKNLRQYEHVH